MINEQQIEKRSKRSDGKFEVHSIFYTIQGEGPFCGTPAVFVRLAGCNLQCPGCDTDYTSQRNELTANNIVGAVQDELVGSPPGLVVITGGEPFRQDLTTLFQALVGSGFYVQVETNGTLEPCWTGYYNLVTEERTGVYVVCSPKTGKVHQSILDIACCLKYVANAVDINPRDGLPDVALFHPASPRLARPPANWKRPVYLQPQDEKNPTRNFKNVRACVSSCMKFGHILQLQIHKIVGVE